jgi:hypothetical protein
MMTLLVVLATAAAMAGGGREHVVDCAPVASCGDPIAYGDTFDWQHRTPLEFIEVLRLKGSARTDATWYTVDGRHRGWVLESDIPRLVELIDSSTTCAAVVSSVSSVIPTKSSTIGREAMFLIEGYRSGVFPPAITSEHCSCNRDEIRRWWAGREHGRSGT